MLKNLDDKRIPIDKTIIAIKASLEIPPKKGAEQRNAVIKKQLRFKVSQARLCLETFFLLSLKGDVDVIKAKDERNMAPMLNESFARW